MKYIMLPDKQVKKICGSLIMFTKERSLIFGERVPKSNSSFSSFISMDRMNFEINAQRAKIDEITTNGALGPKKLKISEPNIGETIKLIDM